MEHKAGIWQGRFQFVHKGHYSIYKKILTKYEVKYIAIVNPNPIFPSFNFERFSAVNNPFSYFKRMVMWKLATNPDNLDIHFFPCWHGQYRIALENEFLPSINTRCWIVPAEMDESEDHKKTELNRQGENVYSVPYEEIVEHQVSSTVIRKRLKENKDWKKFLPSEIHEYTYNIINGIDIFKYYLIPIIDDKLDLCALNEGIKRIKEDKNAFLVFVITVGVAGDDGEDGVDQTNASRVWWFNRSERLNNNLTFAKKVNIVSNYLKDSLNQVLFTPYFILNNDANNLYEYCQAFLPTPNNSYWLISQNTYDNYYFVNTLENDDVQIIDNFSLDIESSTYSYFEKNRMIIVLQNYPFNQCSINKSKAVEFLKNKTSELIDKLKSKIENCNTHINNPQLKEKMLENIQNYEQIKNHLLSFKVSKIAEINNMDNIDDNIYKEIILSIENTINQYLKFI